MSLQPLLVTEEGTPQQQLVFLRRAAGSAILQPSGAPLAPAAAQAPHVVAPPSTDSSACDPFVAACRSYAYARSWSLDERALQWTEWTIATHPAHVPTPPTLAAGRAVHHHAAVACALRTLASQVPSLDLRAPHAQERFFQRQQLGPHRNNGLDARQQSTAEVDCKRRRESHVHGLLLLAVVAVTAVSVDDTAFSSLVVQLSSTSSHAPATHAFLPAPTDVAVSSPFFVVPPATWLRFDSAAAAAAAASEDLPSAARSSRRRNHRSRRSKHSPPDDSVLKHQLKHQRDAPQEDERDKRRKVAAAAGGGDVIAAPAAAAVEDDDLIILSQAPSARRTSTAPLAHHHHHLLDDDDDVMAAFPSAPASRSSSASSSRRSSLSSLHALDAAWSAEAIAAADQFPNFDEPMGDDVPGMEENEDAIVTCSQMARECQVTITADPCEDPLAAAPTIQQAAPFLDGSASISNAPDSVAPMDIDGKHDTSAGVAAVAPSAAAAIAPTTRASPSPHPAPASTSSPQPSSSSALPSAFVLQLVAMRKVLVTRLSVGATYETIERALLALMASAASMVAATSLPPLTSAAILAALKSQPKLAGVSAPLRQFFVFASSWRDLSSAGDFDSACAKFDFGGLALPALLITLAALLDPQLSGARARAVLQQGLLPKLRSTHEQASSSSRNALPYVFSLVCRSSHEPSLISAVLGPWLDGPTSNEWLDANSSATPGAQAQQQLLQGLLTAQSPVVRLSEHALSALVHHLLVGRLRAHSRALDDSSSPARLSLSPFLAGLLAQRALANPRLRLPPPKAHHLAELLESAQSGTRAWAHLLLDGSSEGDVTSELLACMLLAAPTATTPGTANATHSRDNADLGRLVQLLSAYVSTYSAAHAFAQTPSLARLLRHLAQGMGDAAQGLLQNLS